MKLMINLCLSPLQLWDVRRKGCIVTLKVLLETKQVIKLIECYLLKDLRSIELKLLGPWVENIPWLL